MDHWCVLIYVCIFVCLLIHLFNYIYEHLKEKAMATHSSTLAWKIPWTEEPGKAAVRGVAKSQPRLSDFTFTFHFPALEKEMSTHSSVLAWRIPGMGEPGGLPSMGSYRVGHDWSDLAAAAAARTPKIPWTEEPGGLQSMGLQRVGQDWTTEHALLLYAKYLLRTLIIWHVLC